jgi:hypothetical protein
MRARDQAILRVDDLAFAIRTQALADAAAAHHLARFAE